MAFSNFTKFLLLIPSCCCCSVAVKSNSLWPHELQHARLFCPSLSSWVCSNSCPLSQWCHPTILSSIILFLPSVFPSIRVFFSESALCIRWPKYWSFSFSISPSNIIFRVDFLYIWLVWSPCCPRDSQESSPAPQFECINSSALSLLYGPTLTSVHDYWKNHSFDYTDLCQQSNVTSFLICCLDLS